MLIPKTASCDTLYTWAVKNGRWHPYTETPEPGDLVIFDFQGKHTRNQHVGVLEQYYAGTAVTVEGNTSATSDDNGGAVLRRTRSRSVIKGYIRPAYTTAQTAEALIAIAARQIGVKESPANSNNVKYNTWYYGQAVSGAAYPWCAAFVSWCCAVLAGEIAGVSVPETTGKEETVMVSCKVLGKGSTGSAVKKLQILLNGLGYSCGTVDGDFGGKTRAAVVAYQKAQGLAQDGVVGAATWGRLIG